MKILQKHFMGNSPLMLMAILCIAASLANVKAEPIIIDPSNPNPFNYSSNQSNFTEINRSADYFANITDQTLKKLIDALVNSTTTGQEERELLKAVIQAQQKNQRDFTDALTKLDYAYTELKSERDKAVTGLSDYTTQTKVRLETMQTDIDGLRMENTKLKAYVFFYIFLGLGIGVLTIEIATYLRKNQKLYFVLRFIREKIPIRF